VPATKGKCHVRGGKAQFEEWKEAKHSEIGKENGRGMKGGEI